MLTETVQEWTAEWVEQGRRAGRREGREQGREEGREQGRREGCARERALLCRQAARKFDAEAGERLATLIADIADEDRMAEVGDAVIKCGTADELFARLSRAPAH